MKTPNELFRTLAELGTSAKNGIIKLMKDHNVTSINTKVYIMDYDFDYTYKEEINVLNENQYNFVCEINDNYDNTIYFYYNLNEEQTHLDGVVFNHSYADYTIFSVKVEMDFKEVDGKVYTTSTYTEQFIGIDTS